LGNRNASLKFMRCAFAAMMLLPGAAYADKVVIEMNMTGSGLLKLCKSESTDERSACSQFINLVVAAKIDAGQAHHFCMFDPNAAKHPETFTEVAVKYLEAHPSEAYNKPAVENISLAMKEAFPCAE
jgi:hypothetical protein